MTNLSFSSARLCIALLVCLASAELSAQVSSQGGTIHLKPTDWPSWRGPNVDGVSQAQQIPTSWSAEENVLWKADLSGGGHSSPIVVGGKVFVTTAAAEGQVQALQSIDLASGTSLWNTKLHAGQFPKIHRDNTQASATPATDGVSIFTAFGNQDGIQLSAVDLDGTLIWTKTVGPYPSEHGFCSSVCLFENLVFVAGEALGTGFIGAFDKTSGNEIWRQPRTPDREHANYATPVVVQLAGRPQLIIGGWHLVSSYDPKSGEMIWENPGPADVNANSISIRDPYLVVSGGYPQKEIICIKADEPEGDHGRKVVWSSKKNVCWVPSPLIHDDRVLILSDNGVLADLELMTGEAVWTQRVGSKAYASPIQVGDLFIAPTRDGKATVFKSTAKFELVAENTVPGSGNATPVAVQDRLLIRSDATLYCIGERKD